MTSSSASPAKKMGALRRAIIWGSFPGAIELASWMHQISWSAGGDIQNLSPRPVAMLAKAEVSEQPGNDRDGEKQSFPSGEPWAICSRRASSLPSVNLRISTLPGYCKETDAMLRTAAQQA